jgi:hypothetical protein
MKVECGHNLIWDDKSRRIMFFTHKCDVHLFGAATADVDKLSSVTIHKSGYISRYKLKFNHTSFIRFICRWRVQNYEYEINVAIDDK